jgi:2-oxo-4-hydroxy-4-carboxy-5-ureidoimidazoline decarboxylase
MQRPDSQVRQHSVAWLDHLADEQAIGELRTCCAADAWVYAVLRRRPFGALEALLDTAEDLVLAMDDAALDQALAAHARIGERRSGTGREDSWSRTEQAAALVADDDIVARLAEGNRRYEERFGHVFLIRAAGRSAEDMYAALQERLDNDKDTERSVVRQELAEIVRLRLTKLVSE